MYYYVIPRPTLLILKWTLLHLWSFDQRVVSQTYSERTKALQIDAFEHLDFSNVNVSKVNVIVVIVTHGRDRLARRASCCCCLFFPLCLLLPLKYRQYCLSCLLIAWYLLMIVTCARTRTHTHTHTHTCMHARTHTHTHTRMHAHTYARASAHITNAYTPTQVHTHWLNACMHFLVIVLVRGLYSS